jgi:ribosomal protein S18 acetylase RimI-like enzyme
MTIRKAEKKDLPQIAEFEKEISIISFGDEAIVDLAFHEKKLTKSYDKNSEGMFVMEADGKVGGWLWMEPKTNFLTEDRYINFHSFYVAEEFRGKPEAEELMAFGMDFCKKVKATSVVGKVNVNNLAMRSLYKKFGFRATHLTMEWQAEEND